MLRPMSEPFFMPLPEDADPMLLFRKKPDMPTADTALKGRATEMPTAKTNVVNGRELTWP